MKTILVCVLTLAGCNSLPDTPVGNYPIGPVNPLQNNEGVTYRCFMGSAEVIVRGAKNPDPQACVPIQRI